ncbi:hypothetical protein CA984_19730 [Streptosporangium minutum]|uniref:Uncharacterized protein n=1 Tax=Streptosporangium minutum TaxID=569862 RepID=A0A243RJP6_9ACTN|nr:hypothetical protein CA984_19730 [Streptosporangium minutum]
MVEVRSIEVFHAWPVAQPDACFALRSETVKAAEIAARIGLEPDEATVRGSRMRPQSGAAGRQSRPILLCMSAFRVFSPGSLPTMLLFPCLSFSVPVAPH